MHTVARPKELKDTMYYRNIPVFIYQIKYPFFSSTCSLASARSINKYYEQTAKEAEDYCRTVLYPQALSSAKYIQDDRPFNSYTFDMIYKITYNSGCLTSLYRDSYTYMGGAHGETKRTSETWDFKTGTQLQLNDIYPLSSASRYSLQQCMQQQAAMRLKENPGSYFDNYKTLLADSFHPGNFYLCPGCFVIYYQQYDIAPYSTGLPEFYFPFIAKDNIF